MFDAGAIVSRMVLDRKEWTQSMERVKESVQDVQDRFVRMNRMAQRGVDQTAAAIDGMGDAMRRAGGQISRAGTQLAFFGAALSGPVLLAFNAMKNISPQVAHQIERLKNVTQNFQLQLAQAAVPIVERFVNILGQLLAAFNSLDPVLRQQIIQWTLIAGIGMIVSGVFLSVAGKLLSLVGFFISAAASVVAFLGPWGLLAVAVLGVAAAFGKLDEIVRLALDAIETGLYTIGGVILSVGNFMLETFSGMTFALQKFYELLGKLPGALGEPYQEAAKSVQDFRTELEDMIATNSRIIEDMRTKATTALNGPGGMSNAFDDVLQKIEELKKALSSIGSTPIDFSPVVSSLSLMKDAWRRTADGMASVFSNLFFDAVTGKLKSLKDYFADFGRIVLRILSEVIAKLLITKLLGSIAIPGMGTPFNLLGGNAEGIEEVPHTGVYRLHPGEKVVPKYDANKNSGQPIEIVNVITEEAQARIMASKSGRNTILNIINDDALRRGRTRHTMRNA